MITQSEYGLTPRLRDRANIQQMHSKYTCTTSTCALIVRRLLDVCLIV